MFLYTIESNSYNLRGGMASFAEIKNRKALELPI